MWYRSCANRVNCGVVEWVKRNKLRWYGHIERMGSEEFVKKVFISESVGPNRRRQPGRWRDRVKEYMCERDATRRGRAGSNKRVLGQGEVETSAVTTPFGVHPGESKASEL